MDADSAAESVCSRKEWVLDPATLPKSKTAGVPKSRYWRDSQKAIAALQPVDKQGYLSTFATTLAVSLSGKRTTVTLASSAWTGQSGFLTM